MIRAVRRTLIAAAAVLAAAAAIVISAAAESLSPGIYDYVGQLSDLTTNDGISYNSDGTTDLFARITIGNTVYNCYLGGRYGGSGIRVNTQQSAKRFVISYKDKNANEQYVVAALPIKIEILKTGNYINTHFFNLLQSHSDYPAPVLSIYNHMIVWDAPVHSGTLLSYEVLRYDDDDLIARLPPDATSYQPLSSDRLYIRAYYETQEGEGISADSNDVDYIAFYAAPVLSINGYTLSWTVPTDYPDGAALIGYQLLINGQVNSTTTGTSSLITAPGDYSVKAIYSPYNTFSAASNVETFTATADDYIILINNQLTLIRQMLGGDGETSSLMEQLMEQLQGLAQESTLQDCRTTLTQLYEAVLSHYSGQDPATQAVVERLDNISQQLQEVPELIIPEIQNVQVSVADLGEQIQGMAASMDVLSPLSGLFFGHPKIALYTLISIILTVGVAVLRHGVD